jgi:hypothetical protein
VTPPGWFSGFIDILVVIGAFLPFTVPARKVIREKLPTYYA